MMILPRPINTNYIKRQLKARLFDENYKIFDWSLNQVTDFNKFINLNTYILSKG